MLSVGEIAGVKVENTIPESAYLNVHTRANSDKLAEGMETYIHRMVDSEVRASIRELNAATTNSQYGV